MTANFNRSSAQLIIVDDFYQDPDQIRKEAVSASYEEHPAHHKGYQSPQFLYPFVRERFQELLNCQIIDWTQQPYNGVFRWNPEETQVVVHSDTQDYAASVFLNISPPAGTGLKLYRDKIFGLRQAPTTTDAEWIGRSLPEIEQMMYGGKLLDPSQWNLEIEIPAVYNRLVIWNGRLVHSAAGYFGKTLQDSRLNQLFFFNVKH